MVLRKRISSPVSKEDIGSSETPLKSWIVIYSAVPYISPRFSAPRDTRQIRSLSPLSYAKDTSEADRNRINKIKRRDAIPSSKARPRSPVIPDYSALRELTYSTQTSRLAPDQGLCQR